MGPRFPHSLVARFPSVNSERRRQREMERVVSTRQKWHLLHDLAALEFPSHHGRRVLLIGQSSASLGSREGNQIPASQIEECQGSQEYRGLAVWGRKQSAIPFIFIGSPGHLYTDRPILLSLWGLEQRETRDMGMGPIGFRPGWECKELREWGVVCLDLLLELWWPVDWRTGVGKKEKRKEEMESVPSGPPTSSKCLTGFCHLEALLCGKKQFPLYWASLHGFL